MSFSSSVKKELSENIDKARHCRIAELAAIIGQNGSYSFRPGGAVMLTLASENILILRKAEQLLRLAFSIAPELSVSRSKDWNGVYCALIIRDQKDVDRVLSATKYMLGNGVLLELRLPVDRRIIQGECCKKAYLRGLFLCSGSVNNPARSYHFEISFEDRKRASQVVGLLGSFGIEARITAHKNMSIVYIKESDDIADTFRVMGAPRSLMEYENARILRSITGDVNRKVNCETANLAKSVNAGMEQLADIELIRVKQGLDSLPDSLRKAALARMEYPEESLTELGNKMDPPVGKSGMNHRFRRLKAIADKLR
jgi:DNA-binding protein WhiA